MKTLFDLNHETYTGEQLRPLHNYLRFGLLGTSMLSWVGPCNVKTDHMIDGEDVRAQEKICGDKMVHFIAEMFDVPLRAAVVWQRLMAEMTVRWLVQSKNLLSADFSRKGDDIYYKKRKLNISIATAAASSTLLHFAVNVVAEGTPIATSCLEEMGVSAEEYALEMLKLVQAEFKDVEEAVFKVKTF